MCLVLATLYLEAVKFLERVVFMQGFSMDPRYVTALVELRRVMLCGRKLVTEWTQKDWWTSVITSSDSASVLQKITLHLREFHECVKVLIQIKMKLMVHPDLHPWNADGFVKLLLERKFIVMGDDPTVHLVAEHFSGDIDSLISSIEEYKRAAKVFHTNCIDMQAVEKEAKLFSELRHPNVVQFIGYGVKGCQSVIVSELMSKDLRTYLVDEKKNAGQGPPLPLLVAINIMVQVAEAMNYLHEMGVMHCDLKATNVLINVLENQDGLLSSMSVQAKLTDFGESKGKLHGSSIQNYAGIHGKPSISGWGMSEDWKFSFGVSSLDAKVTIGERIAIIDGQIVACFGVFGTLPGSGVEDYWLFNLFGSCLLRHPHFLDEPKLAIVETYKQIDQILWEKGNSQHVVARSKACMCVLVGDHLLVANVGDSRAVICTYGEAITLSTDHTPYQAQIEDPGPVVRYNHWLVGGGSGVPQLEQNVLTEPEIHEVTIEEGVDFLVLGTTGLWSVVSKQDAVTMAEYMPDAEKAAKRFVEEAYRRGSLDDVTCVIVRFHHVA
ncbi:unnamed protein product [Sphagnum jensenii]